MLSNKEIICPNNLLDVAHKKKGVKAAVVNAGMPLPMLSVQDAVKENIKIIKKLPKIKGFKEIMYPGQNKYKRFRMNSKKEINISEVVKKDLRILRN